MSDHARRIANFSPEQLDSLVQQAHKKRANAARAVISPRKRASNISPLSLAQQRLWFLDQLVPGVSAYNVPIFLHLTGNLDVAVLERSINEIVRRHEVLRTTFATVAGQPAQLIAPTLNVPLPLLDLTRIGDREAEVQRQAAMEQAGPFDLARGPLIRSHLLRLDEQNHVLLLTAHHIVLDGWSIGIFFQELAALYPAFAAGRPSPLPELSIQYADFAAWQREWLSSPAPDDSEHTVLEAQLAYWQRQLEGAPPALELPTDYPRPAIQSFRGAHYSFMLPQDLLRGLRALGQREGVTLFMTLLAAFQVLLSCYSEQEDIVVGTDVANRSHLETENLIGFFVNQLVLRTDLSGHPSFQELLARVRMVTLEAYAHQDLPFDQVVEALQPARDLSRNPLFQVLFTLQNTPLPSFQFAGLTLRPFEVESHTAQFDISLALAESTTGLGGVFEYNSDLFAAETVARMAGHYHTLLASVLASPSQRIATLPLFPPHELLPLLTGSPFGSPESVGLLERFAQTVAQHPEAIAVSDQEGQLTYRRLAQTVEQAARHLRAQGVTSESLVAVLLPRSSRLLVTLLSIWQAGGAYLPLSPEHPATRLRQLLQHSRPQVLLSCAQMQSLLQEILSGLPPNERPQVLLFDELEQPATTQLAWPEHLGRQLAYVLFTSGSTGVPKGAMIEHRGMLNHLLAKIGDLALTRSDTVAQTASASFDISLWQLVAALLVGGRVHVVADEVARDPFALLQAVQQQAISVLETVPSLLHLMLLTLEQADQAPMALPGLRWLIPTGEILPPELCRRWLALYPYIPLLNAYGPTECSDDVTHQPIQEPPTETCRRVPIGRPLPNTHLYVLSRAGMLQPIGVPGELYVGGVGVGRGYLGEPERTGECFVPDPFSATPGARLYRTGDQVRALADGSLEFVGRLDGQVKLHGYRIELSEIEMALRRHPDIEQALVLLREESAGRSQLVAYVLASQQPGPTSGELRAYLKEWLPDYMIPAAFVFLETLPLLPNGKLDRQALPPPEHTGQEPSLAAPRTPVEAALVEIWAEVLDREQVSIYDNFFELGGDSILSIQIIIRAYQVGLHFTPMELFQYQTIADLATRIRSGPIEPGDAAPSTPARSSEEDGYTSSDFPEAQLSAEKLNELLATLDEFTE